MGEATGTARQADELVVRLRARLAAVAERVAGRPRLTVFVLEWWRGHETRARLASPSSWTAREAFRHVVQSRVPHGAIAPTELNRIIDSVVDANELFFTDSIPALEAAVGGMSNSFAARAPPPAAADGGGRGRDDGSAAVQAPFAGTPYFIDLLAMSVFDTAVGLDFATAAPSSSSPSSPSATIHNGSITATSPSSYADEPVVTCARALSGAAAVAAMTIMPSAFTEERLLRFVSPIAAFEHFVALRLHRSMQVLRGSQSQQQSGDGAGGGGAGASARPQPVCYSSVTPAIKQLIDQAGRTALRMLTAAADDVSLASQPQSQQHRRSQVLSSSGPSGLVFSMADLMISGGVTGAGVGSSVASSLSSAAGGITKSIVNFFSSAASSSSSTSSARDGGVGTAAAAAALTAWAETLCDAGLMTRCDRHADASCTTTPTATPVAHHHHHPPSQRPHGADAAADASPSSSPPPPSPASHLATATATIFTTYSFRNRMDMELFAACFVSHEVSHRESLPWHPFLRVAWLVLASHVALSERRHAREARPQTIGFQQTLSTRFVDAYHARRVAIGRDRIRLLDATSLDANEDATCSNLVVEVAQAFDAVGGCDAVFEAVSCQHGLHVNLPSHTFWMFDACGRFGFVSALNALHARIGSNGDLSRRDVPSELWQRLVLLAATSGQCDDAALDRIVLLATEFHPWLQELQLNAPQRMRLSFA